MKTTPTKGLLTTVKPNEPTTSTGSHRVRSLVLFVSHCAVNGPVQCIVMCMNGPLMHLDPPFHAGLDTTDLGGHDHL